jgi:glycosyltransferase involved in cell wall biosynthesis
MEVTSIHSDNGPMRILFVTQSLGKGGAERLVLDIANEIKRNYPEVSVKIVSLSPVNDYLELCSGLDIEVCNSYVKLSISGRSIIEISDFEQIVDEYKPDVIHSHTYKSELVSRENVRSGITYFTHVHNHFPEFESLDLSTFFNKIRITRYFERIRILKYYKKSNNQFVTISKSIDSKLRKQLPKEWSDNIHLIHNGVNLKKFNSQTKSININDPIELISVGRLDPIKNQEYLILVLFELKKLMPHLKWNLTILGIGSEKENLINLVKKLSLCDSVQMPGIVSDVEVWLKKSHIYIQSSISESFGLSYVEAMAASLPLVSLDAGGNRDIISNNKDGYILPQNTSPVDFAETIIPLILSSELYYSISQAANKKSKLFDIKKCTESLYLLYNEQISLMKSK